MHVCGRNQKLNTRPDTISNTSEIVKIIIIIICFIIEIKIYWLRHYNLQYMYVPRAAAWNQTKKKTMFLWYMIITEQAPNWKIVFSPHNTSADWYIKQ